jgi:hypothetical protein
MSAASSSDQYRRGVRFVYATRLPAGRHRITFRAMSADGATASARGGTILIVARRSGGASTGSTGGGSTGSATTGSTGSDPSTGSGADPGTAGGGFDAPAAGPTPTEAGPAAGGDSGRNDATGSPGAVADLRGGPADAANPAAPSGAIGGVEDLTPPDAGDPGGLLPATAAGGPVASVGQGSVPGGASAAGGGGSDGSRGSDGSDPSAIDLTGRGHGPFDGVFRAYPVLVTTTGTVVVWAAFVFFGKRRRDGEPSAPDEVLAAHAAAAPEPQPVVALVPPDASQQRIPPGADPTEAGLPRWRRPSLLQARKADPLRTATTFASLSFDDGAVEPYDGLERRRIRYRLVSLMDVPDEVRANEIGIVDEGDEVQVIEAQGTYRLVLCPDGQQGWLHKMVLGDLVGDDRSGQAPDGIDEDVLAAFLTVRRQSA